MTLYIGVVFHPHQQTVAWCDTDTGETNTATLLHELEKVKRFYQQLPSGIVGIEASSKAIWFENLLIETNHQLQVGNPVLIRKRATSRHKSDKRDAELILDLLIKQEFPAIWRRSRENDQVLDILKLRHSLVRQRTQTYNRLQSLAKVLDYSKARSSQSIFRFCSGELRLMRLMICSENNYSNWLKISVVRFWNWKIGCEAAPKQIHGCSFC
jgi:hypothetical protein